MIGVLADDFTGAAETAAAAFAAGLTAEVQTHFDSSTDADVVAVDTDTRSHPDAAVVSAAAERMRRAGPAWIFKKVDSLLRGDVVAEVDAVRRVFGFGRALVVPANPAIGRTIRDGKYLIEGEPLSESSLADDPEHPRTTSDVRRLLDLDAPSRLTLPDAASADDLRRLAEEMEADELPAGSGAFFEALLRARAPSIDAPRDDIYPEPPSLFVCGSLAAWRSGRAEDAASRGIRVFGFPSALLDERCDEDAIEGFAREIKARLSRIPDRPVLIAIGRSEPVFAVTPGTLVVRLAMVAERLLGGFRSVFVEGGASSSVLVRRMGWTRLRVVGRSAPGVVTLRPAAAPKPGTVHVGLILTVKVGSYAWPEIVWRSALNDR